MTKKKTEKITEPKVQFVVEKFQDSKDYYSELRSKWEDWDNLFLSVPSPKKYDWMSNLFIPETHKAVMTLLSRLVNNTNAVDPNFDVVPSNSSVSNLIRSQTYRGNFFIQYVFFCLQLLIRGTSVAKISWKKDTRTKFTLEKVMERFKEKIIDELTQQQTEVTKQKITGYTKKPKEIIRYDGPVFENIDLFDFYPAEQSVNISDGARVFRSVKTIDEFTKGTNYINKDKVIGTSFPENEDFTHSRLTNLGISSPSYEASSTLKEKAKDLSEYVELLECETPWFNPKTEKMENWLFTVANREILVRDEAFPYWNTDTMYLKGVWLPMMGEFYGIGIPELSECLQEELNDKRNQRIDNLNQILQPIFMYEEGSIDPKVMNIFERKPGGRLRLRPGGINATKWDECPDVTAGAMVECQVLENNIEEVTGAVKAIQPASTGQDIHRTSSGLMLLQSMANERIKLNLNFLEKMVLEPMWEKYFDLNLQLLTPGYKIFNPEGQAEVYTPELIVGDYEFRAKGSRYALDQQMKVMNLSRALESLGATGIPPGELHIKFWVKLYEALGFEDKDKVEEILRKEIQQFKQQQQMLAQAKAQGGQGGAGGSPVDIAGLVNQLSGGAGGANQVRSDMGSMIPGGQ